jgi:quercetin dioxygenase-like cupin family protein
MRIFRTADAPAKPADRATFVGEAAIKRLASADEGVPVMVYHVDFDERGRTNWHAHSGAQWLLIIDGRVRVQTWGHPPEEVGAGDAVMIAPGDKHWHGAAPGARGVHLAVNVNSTTEWFEPVTDQQYDA